MGGPLAAVRRGIGPRRYRCCSFWRRECESQGGPSGIELERREEIAPEGADWRPLILEDREEKKCKTFTIT